MEVKLQSGQSTLCAGNFSIAAAQIRYLGFSKRPLSGTQVKIKWRNWNCTKYCFVADARGFHNVVAAQLAHLNYYPSSKPDHCWSYRKWLCATT